MTASPFDDFDRLYQANLARLTLGLTPAGLGEAYGAWLAHLAISPGRLAELALFPWLDWPALLDSSKDGAKDPRFASSHWQLWPWQGLAQGFAQAERFWQRATTGIEGLSPQYQQILAFAARQYLDALSPSNYLASNPDLLHTSLQQLGQNLVKGAQNALEDWRRNLTCEAPVGTEAFEPGRDLACTPGKVVYRNGLMELIQYQPAGPSVHKEPVLVMPAWIMKYYILDLSPHNSLVRYLLEQGHSVFMISWKNPGPGDRDLGMEDYVRDGALAAIDVVQRLAKGAPLHLAGYCLGGTLALLTAAHLGSRPDNPLQTLTLFAAQGDFTEAGELMIFVTPSEVAYLKSMMWAQGTLDTKQMAGAFQLLRSNDLIWSRLVHEYLQGERSPMSDLMAWNSDATRMPYKMHSEYLEKLFLNNEFAEGRYQLFGQPVAAGNIKIPIFAVGTEKDHVAPWVSVHKVHLLSTSDVTFVLASGGHNGGIVSEPGRPHRHYRIALKKAQDPYLSPKAWQEAATPQLGSWWPAWQGWLAQHSSGQVAAPKGLGSRQYPPLGDAPGHYVFDK
ncbi:PHA/PHB synthase family protein [Gallaecimonas xiamenensis]|uniref:Polyhydroxyalkanoic synthase n=1 Tax=Gallaecimonas xiamenensis 3-C-1 TaxID=745411 RepID=K2J1B1_9GAMM|nr:alpha/beta fold hydrolase [Gallaecimonas xiamenensis]EKE68923.1 polyhydroxyalkanoic synthase [Gallaecimonas xiamenensis 3-C-1]